MCTPLAVETSVVCGAWSQLFFTELGRRMIQNTKDSLTRCHTHDPADVRCSAIYNIIYKLTHLFEWDA